MRLSIAFLVLNLLLFAICTASLEAAENEASLPGPFAPAVAAAQNRTVKIYGGTIGRSPGYATGIIVSDKGEILTEQGSMLASGTLRVVLPDGSEHTAQVVRRSQTLQVALLKIDAATPLFFDLTPREDAAAEGDWILAVSNCFKVAEGAEALSVNMGVLSLRMRLDARRGLQDFPYDGDVLLIDAITSNPGAAGGAVVDLHGELVGMIGKVIEGKSTNTRLNYAVPRDHLADFLAGKEPTGNSVATSPATRGDLGLRLFPLGGRKSPAYIDRVVPSSPAAVAGLKADDLIVSVAGQVIKDVGDYERVAETLAAGTEVTLEVKRRAELLMFKLTPAAK